LPQEPEAAAATRSAAVTAALLRAAKVPLETARACADVAELASAVAARGNTNAVSDAGVAALLADAGCKGAAFNVRINVAALEDRSLAAPLVEEATRLVEITRKRAADAVAQVEAAVGLSVRHPAP
jgi:glutamate formiminotransferase/formiminotetrahydrofolate cyclodeaminase